MTLEDIRSGLTAAQIQAAKDFYDKYFNPDTKQMEPFVSGITTDWTGDPSQANGVQTSTGIPPEYCASPACGNDVHALLGVCGFDSSVFEQFPKGDWTNIPGQQFTQSAKVPWLHVSGTNSVGQPVTVNENAAQLAYAFSHGYPVADCLASILDWVGQDLQMVAPGQ